jgi:outer membrane protein assembly factor BamB
MTYHVPEGVHHREVDGEVVILDMTGDSYFSLNDSGVVIWNRLTGGGTLAEAAADLMAQFEISESQSRGDVADLAAELIAANLLVPA